MRPTGRITTAYYNSRVTHAVTTTTTNKKHLESRKYVLATSACDAGENIFRQHGKFVESYTTRPTSKLCVTGDLFFCNIRQCGLSISTAKSVTPLPAAVTCRAFIFETSTHHHIRLFVTWQNATCTKRCSYWNAVRTVVKLRHWLIVSTSCLCICWSSSPCMLHCL